MYRHYAVDSQPADLKREFEAVEEAAKSMDIKLYCRDLVQILKLHIDDTNAEFFMSCFHANDRPYKDYTINGYVRQF